MSIGYCVLQNAKANLYVTVVCTSNLTEFVMGFFKKYGFVTTIYMFMVDSVIIELRWAITSVVNGSSEYTQRTFLIGVYEYTKYCLLFVYIYSKLFFHIGF